MCDIYSTRRALMLVLWFSFWAIHIVQTDALFRILPKVEKDEQVNEEGSTLTFDCIVDKITLHGATDPRWILPRSEWEAQWEGGQPGKLQTIENRLNITIFRNETQLITTMTLINLTVTDTGNYKCEGQTRQIRFYGPKQFVYVSSNERLILETPGDNYANYVSNNENINRDNSRIISFITTHPNVSISLFKVGTKRDTYLEVWNSSNKNSRWSFNPRNGLTLKNPTIFDSGIYYIFGHLPFVNGKPVNITHSDSKTKWIIREIFPVDRIDAIDGLAFPFLVPGIEVERVGAPDDPLEGSNVTLICTSYRRRRPQTWFYYADGNATWHKLSNEFLKQPNADIRNEIEETPSGFYKRKLHLINVTLNTPYTKFKCAYGDDNSKDEEISFTIKEIDNDPLSNSIVLEQGVGQNLICNRLSQDIPIHWLKDGAAYFDSVYENETASIVRLQGKETEKGIYECRWKNSKREPRHKKFTVGISFKMDKKDTNTIIIITSSFIGLLAVAVGIGIKVYLDKRSVKRELEKMLIGDLSRIDPDVPMEYQTEFLPYDKKWEFPRKRLRLGQELLSKKRCVLKGN